MNSRVNLFLTFTRNYASVPRKWKREGVKYGLITYYPRNKHEVDPPITPTKLLLVHRVKSYKYNPYWQKDALDSIGFDKDKRNEPVVVKNTPEMCALLWKIKHLIKVVPLKLPEKMPDLEKCSTYLHENGTLMVIPKIDMNRYIAAWTHKYDPKRLRYQKMSDDLKSDWLRGHL